MVGGRTICFVCPLLEVPARLRLFVFQLCALLPQLNAMLLIGDLIRSCAGKLARADAELSGSLGVSPFRPQLLLLQVVHRSILHHFF